MHKAPAVLLAAWGTVALLGLSTLGPTRAANLIPNGDFERSGAQNSPAGWGVVPFAGAPGGALQLMSRGWRGTQSLQVKVTDTPSMYGVFSAPAEVEDLPSRDLLLTCAYKTTSLRGARLSLVGFGESFLAQEWRTPYLQNEVQILPPASDWTVFAWHFRVQAGVKELLTLFEVDAAGQLLLDDVSLQPFPTEVVCAAATPPGVVCGLPDRRAVELKLSNAGDGDRALQVLVEATGGDLRRPVRASLELDLPRGETRAARLEYKVEARQSHHLRVLVQDTRTGVVYECNDYAVPGLLEARLTSPAFRQTLLETLPPAALVLGGRWNLSPELRRDAQVEAELLGASQQSKFTVEEGSAGDDRFTLSLPLPSLLTGEHTVRVSARVGNLEQTLDLPLRRLAPGLPEVAYDDQLRLAVQGRRLLPVGIFGVEDENDVRRASQAGFNFVVTPAQRASYALQEVARQTNTLVAIFGSELESDYWQRLQVKWGQSSLALGWIPFSRPDLRATPVALAQHTYETLREISPNLPVFETLASPSLALRYAEVADILVAWSLPVPYTPLTSLGEMIDVLTQASEGTRPVWAMVQATRRGLYREDSTGQEKAGRAPTPAEMEALTYLALLHGARGLLWYAYAVPGSGAGSWHLPLDAPELWAALPELLRRLEWLTPVLLEGEREPLPPAADGAVEMARWRYQGSVYLIAVNTGDKGLLTPLPLSAASARVQVLFEDRTETTDADGELQESFAPCQTHVYLVENAEAVP